MPELIAGQAKTEAIRWLGYATEAARKSNCIKRHCGAVMVSSDGQLLGTGFNKLPEGCSVHCSPYAHKPGFKADRTCCAHAEQRAVLEAMRDYPSLVRGGTLYLVMMEADDQDIRPVQKPYCTHCSKMAIDVGIALWVLPMADGLVRYTAQEYNDACFELGDNVS